MQSGSWQVVDPWAAPTQRLQMVQCPNAGTLLPGEEWPKHRQPSKGGGNLLDARGSQSPFKHKHLHVKLLQQEVPKATLICTHT
eukprot:1165858-Amphidinium_carterae.1